MPALGRMLESGRFVLSGLAVFLGGLAVFLSGRSGESSSAVTAN
jgi:hypothetical protein